MAARSRLFIAAPPRGGRDTRARAGDRGART
nr:MAG TPA: hypothetical protein [Caudoviricetes sp.]